MIIRRIIYVLTLVGSWRQVLLRPVRLTMFEQKDIFNAESIPDW